MIVGVISKCAEVKIQGLGMPCENIKLLASPVQ